MLGFGGEIGEIVVEGDDGESGAFGDFGGGGWRR